MNKMIIIFILIFLKCSSECSTLRNFAEPRNNIFEIFDICTNYDCVQTAADMLKKMNSSTDPCNNFYNFACGNFGKTISIADGKIIDVFSEVEDNFQEQLRELIAEDFHDHDIRPFKMVKGFYQACMNTDAIDKIGNEPVSRISADVGGWPISYGDFWEGYSWDWQETIANFRKYGIKDDYIFDFSVVVDIKNTSRRLINIDQPEFGIEREYLINGLDDPIVTYYYKYMVDIALMFGTNQEVTMEDLKKSLEFEIQLAQMALSTEERRDPARLYNTMTIKELQAKFPYVNWVNYFNNLLDLVEVDETDTVNVAVPNFFQKLGQLLLATPKKTISNYLLWRFHQFSAPYSNQEIRDRELKFKAERSGRKIIQYRWEECLKATRNNFNIALGALYVRKYFNEEAKSAVLFMASTIQESYRNILAQVDWMDDMTKEAALLKLDNLTAYIGYPDELMNNEIIDNYYKKLEINELFYYESWLNLSKFKNDVEYNNLRKTVIKADWVKYSEITSITPFYSSMDNLIYIPAGFLHEQLFSLDRPNYINFGRIGSIIGHIIVHGFDDKGKDFDLNGNLFNWWSNNTKKLFAEKAKCIIDQYNSENFTEPELSDINTVVENIADLGAFKAGHFSYNNWADQNGRELRLPGLSHFTSNQMYWISAAQNMCFARPPEGTKMDKNYWTSHFRVLGSLSNMGKFSIDFKCEAGTKMNPIEKCNIW